MRTNELFLKKVFPLNKKIIVALLKKKDYVNSQNYDS